MSLKVEPQGYYLILIVANSFKEARYEVDLMTVEEQSLPIPILK